MKELVYGNSASFFLSETRHAGERRFFRAGCLCKMSQTTPIPLSFSQFEKIRLWLGERKPVNSDGELFAKGSRVTRRIWGPLLIKKEDPRKRMAIFE